MYLQKTIAALTVLTVMMGTIGSVESEPIENNLVLGGKNVVRSDNFYSFSPGLSRNDIEKQLLKEHSERNSRDTIPRGDNSAIRNEIYQKAEDKWDRDNAEALVWIVKGESSFNQYATNGNCLGLFQRNYPKFSDEEREAYLNDVQGQIEDGFRYIEGGSKNFHTPIEAKEFWLKNKERTGRGWY